MRRGLRHVVEVHRPIGAAAWWRIVSPNGRIVLTSETYSSLSTCSRMALEFSNRYGFGFRSLAERRPKGGAR